MDAAEGWFFAPPYADGRVTALVYGQSVDFAPIKNRACWDAAFGKGPIDWLNGWQMLWSVARAEFSTGTDFASGITGIEVFAHFANNTNASKDTALKCELSEARTWSTRAIEVLWQLCGVDVPIAGCIGLVTNHDDDHSRPCLTLLVDGPGGAREACNIIYQALLDAGVSAIMARRTIREDAVGVIKVLFCLKLIYWPTETLSG